MKSQLISVLVPDGPEGKFALHLIDDDGCNFGSRDMPFAMGKTDFKAVVTPINELVYKGVFNFPETSRKVECKVRRRWCEAAFEHRSAAGVAGCWRSESCCLTYEFRELPMKPRIRDIWGDLQQEDEDHHEILTPILDNVAMGFPDIDFTKNAICCCACTYDGTRFLQSIVHEAAGKSVATSHRLELVLEAVQESVLQLAVDEYACHLIDTMQYALPWKRISFIAREILRDVQGHGMKLAYRPGGSIVMIGLLENHSETELVRDIVANITEKELLEMANVKHTRARLRRLRNLVAFFELFDHCVFARVQMYGISVLQTKATS